VLVRCGTDKAMAEALSTLESSEWKPWGEDGWLQLCEAVCECRDLDEGSLLLLGDKMADGWRDGARA
jgi:hypothetical protein